MDAARGAPDAQAELKLFLRTSADPESSVLIPRATRVRGGGLGVGPGHTCGPDSVPARGPAHPSSRLDRCARVSSLVSWEEKQTSEVSEGLADERSHVWGGDLALARLVRARRTHMHQRAGPPVCRRPPVPSTVAKRRNRT